MCQSININEFDNTNDIIYSDNDNDDNDDNDDIIMSSKYQYIDECEEGEEMEAMDIFDFNEDFVNKISRETRVSINNISSLTNDMNECYEFNEDIDDHIHTMIDEAITNWTLEDCERLLYNYGIRKGIKEYTDEFGELDFEEDKSIKCVVYMILKNNMTIRIEEVDENNRDDKKIKTYLLKTHKIEMF